MVLFLWVYRKFGDRFPPFNVFIDKCNTPIDVHMIIQSNQSHDSFYACYSTRYLLFIADGMSTRVRVGALLN